MRKENIIVYGVPMEAEEKEDGSVILRRLKDSSHP